MPQGENKGAISTFVPWPFLRSTRGAASGFALWPLFGYEARPGAYRHRYLLWPFVL